MCRFATLDASVASFLDCCPASSDSTLYWSEEELERLGPPARLAALRGIKSGLDPLNLFNPGKLVSLAPRSANP